MTCFSETTIKAARKAHHCDVCARLTEIGQPYVRWTGMSDGYFISLAYHPECRSAEIAFNEVHGTYGEDWTGLNYGREGEDDDWLRTEWPVVAARLGIASPDQTPLSMKAEGRR